MRILLVAAIITGLLPPTAIIGQYFSLVNDSSNLVAIEPDCGTKNNWQNNCFQGAAFGNLNGDQCLDLFYAGNVFLSDCNGNFTKGVGIDLTGFTNKSSSVSLIDFDNDDDLDLLFYNENGFGTKVYENDGQGVFTHYRTVLDSINSTVWSVQWWDYNLDAHADIILTFADGFAGNLHFPNRLFKGSVNHQFEKVQDSLEFLTDLHAYTVSYWIDYDEDGDQDLFIASGPASQTGKDFLYKNQSKETGSANFTKLTALTFASEQQNGQCYNFIDIDNDGDLDACLTNWRIVPNRLYRNDTGVFTATNQPFTTNPNSFSLSNAWGDIDNDGDLDVLITSNNPNEAQYYLNDGSGNFTVGGPIGTLINGPSSGISLGDYNNDGKLDFFITGRNSGLFKNKLSNGNTFVLFDFKGKSSHRSSVGLRAQLKCTIDGKKVWLKREVSAQNTFMGHNAQRVHFGLGNSTIIDSLLIYWPSGSVDTVVNLAASNLYVVNEGKSPVNTPLNTKGTSELIKKTGFYAFPNPSKKLLNIKLTGNELLDFSIHLTTLAGQSVLKRNYVNKNEISLSTESFPTGNYTLELTAGDQVFSKSILIQ